MISALVLLASTVASGCAPQDRLAAELVRYGYAALASGPVAGGDLLMEIYVDGAGNWVAVLTRAADQLSCVKAAGSGWRSQPTGNAA